MTEPMRRTAIIISSILSMIVPNISQKNAIKILISAFILSGMLYSFTEFINNIFTGTKDIKYVIDRSLKFASKVDNINYDMVYVIAAYHDIGHYIDAKNHEKVSSYILFNDVNLKKFFNVALGNSSFTTFTF